MTDTQTTVLVTGASGFIAKHIVLDLLKKGYRVRGTVRDKAKGEAVRQTMEENGADPAGLDIAEADLGSDSGWAGAVAGCRFVLHTASPFPISTPRDPDEIIVPARDGARRVVAAALDAGAERVVLTSSMAAIAYGHPMERTAPYTADDWTRVDRPEVGAYVASKYHAEKAAWAVAAERGLEDRLAVINPALVLGPILDAGHGTSVEIVRRLLTGKMPALPRVGFPVVDVRDVSAMHIAAMETPAAGGQRFPCAGGFMWLEEIAEALRQGLPGQAGKVPRRRMPDWLVRAVALFDRDIRTIAGDLGRVRVLDTSNARKRLGWQPRPDEEAVLAAARSLIDKGVVTV
ncbi:MAG: NAD-dependent epimerase/dehydratase family protein [Azospirillaceae bacterium]